MDFQYKISVIVPIYNTEEYLQDCLNSLVNQTAADNSFEVLLIDDGSTDKSAEICQSFCQKHSFFKYFHRENSGVSKARNFGIQNAKGKYILYLDSDDKLTAGSLEYLYRYFERVYDKVDLVTYFIQPYKNGVPLKTHSRYNKLLSHTGVYDLEENPYIVQTTMNICVKSLGDNNILFNENMTSQEDQEYINRVLAAKLKLGYCTEACYLYNRNNESSAIASKFHAYYLFESTMNYFEELFSHYDDRVPRYFQAVFFHDLRWKLTSKILFPFHYEGEEYERAIGRIKALLARVDDDIIVKNPSINKHHIHFWLSMKPNTYPLPICNEKSVQIAANGKTIQKSNSINMKLLKISSLDNGKIRIRACIDSAVYNYIDELPEVCAVINDDERIPLTFSLSSFGYVATDIMTNKVYGFTLDLDPEGLKKVSFEAWLDSYRYDVHMIFVGTAVFQHSIRRYRYCLDSYLVTYYNDSLLFKAMSKDEVYAFELNEVEQANLETYSKSLKQKSIEYRYNHRVWLYSDLQTVLKDNAYYQFKHDIQKDDGVERYYVYTRELDEIADLFTEEEKKHLVEFGSYQHQLLYLSAEIIISSFYGRDDISPFVVEEEEYKNYLDIEHFKVIYMQHGILHASYVRKYSAERANCDKIVVSSNFEIENLTSKYAYKPDQLITCGMPRFSLIDRSSKAKNRILLAPSWRSYFAANTTSSTYSINIDGFKASDYYRGFMQFLSDKRLHALLEENNMELDVKMHPIIQDVVSDLFSTDCSRINIVKGDVKLEDYALFITDFSSFVFDYAYLERPIMYFVPDYPQFKSGMNLYRELDLPFEKAFGPLSKDADTAIKDIERIFKNDFKAESVYRERMSKFYLDMDNCEEDLYRYITETMFADN